MPSRYCPIPPPWPTPRPRSLPTRSTCRDTQILNAFPHLISHRTAISATDWSRNRSANSAPMKFTAPSPPECASRSHCESRTLFAQRRSICVAKPALSPEGKAPWPTPPSRGISFMPEIQVRKRLLSIEEIFHEGGPVAHKPRQRAAALVVIRNPFAGTYVEEIEGFMDDLKPLGLEMAQSLVKVLGGDAKLVEGYGKGAIVGSSGEIEHGALWHVPGGYAMREVLGGAKAIVASTKKVGGPGTRLDVPITHINASYVRSHFDAMEVGLSDAPRADEILLALVMTTGPRVHARVGGLKASEIKGEDGLR